MATYSLLDHFNSFFKNLNPSLTFENQAATEYSAIKSLLENPYGLASELSPKCFLQGSYKQETAIHTINDVDIVALCNLTFPGSGNGEKWSRDKIFDTVSAPLLANSRYRYKIRCSPTSMCIKVDLGIKVEILPVVYSADSNGNFSKEPFYLFRPQNGGWEHGYARYHQWYLTNKNGDSKTAGRFIPTIKIFKHINRLFNINSISFHVECLLYSLSDQLYSGSWPDIIAGISSHIRSYTADAWYKSKLLTPCGERGIFTATEWDYDNWCQFHALISKIGEVASGVISTTSESTASRGWATMLGSKYFPERISS